MKKSVGNRDLIRAINRSTILNIIKSDGPVGRADIARNSGLSPATVTGITAELINNDLVKEVSLGDSSGGRPQILLALNPKGGYVIGIKLMEDHLIGALTDMETSVVAQMQVDLKSHKPADVVATISRATKELLHNEDLPLSKLIGLGIGLAGLVNHEDGVVKYSPFFGWKNFSLGPKVSKSLGVPVYIDNDVNTFAIAEFLFGSAQDEIDFITVTIGRGIGLAIMKNGTPFRGAAGGAGELGHIVIDEQGPKCSCGNQGCLEMFASEPAILSRANSILGKRLDTIDELVMLAENGNQEVQNIFEDAGTLIGKKIADLITIIGPKLVIVSGEGTRMGDYLFNPMQHAIRQYVMPALRGSFEIRIEPWGDDVWARGAACLVLNQFYLIPNF